MTTENDDSKPFSKSDLAALRALVRELMSVVDSQIEQLESSAIESLKRAKEIIALQERNSDLASSLRFLASAQLTGDTISEIRTNIRKEVSRVFTLAEGDDK